MIEPYRGEFNAGFTDAKYAELLRRLEQNAQTEIGFRVAETPCFFEPKLIEQMVSAGVELTEQLLGNPEYMRMSRAAVPAEYCAPGLAEGAHPHFMTVDFGLARGEDGELQPKLVEMQAFPSLYAYQPLLSKTYMEVFGLDRSLEWTLGGMSEDRYWSMLRRTIVGEHAPENVVLVEIDPERQKTRADFRMTEKALGITTVDVSKLVKEGNRLFYREQKRRTLVPVERIYNRVIVDELMREKMVLPFDYRDDLQVEWAGHPNWYFRVSKYSIPFLNHATVPQAVFLDDWFAGVGRERLPEKREDWVFKPLYSFAGKGIQFAPTEADLAAIPEKERCNYLLQKRISFDPVIQTPEGSTQAEVRILYVWPDGGEMTPMVSLVRMGRGLMMGVDHNRSKTWVGGSAGLMRPI